MKTFSLSLAVAALGATAIFAAPAGTAFTYQGRLNDGGQPAAGNYDFSFILYDALTNGAVVGNAVYLAAVPVTNGLFTVPINENNEFGASAFNGSARWLEVYARTNNNNAGNNFVMLTPRQTLTPAPSALFAQTAFAALNAANVTDGAITGSKLAPGAVTWSNVAGVTAGSGLSLGAGNQLSLNFAGSGASSTAAHSDHGHFGAQWNGATLGNGVSVLNSSPSGAGLFGQQGAGSGQFYFLSPPIGVWGESSEGYGVHGASGSKTGAGVYGLATASNGNAIGVSGLAAGTQGTNCGVQGVTMSAGGTGVYGRNKNSSTNAMRDSVRASGVFGESRFAHGVAGASDFNSGVIGISTRGAGVAGFSTEGYYGVFGESVSETGVGGWSTSGDGVSGYSDHGNGVAAFGYTGAGLRATSASGNPIEAYQDGIVPTRRFYVNKTGEVYASGAFHPGGADFAEMLPAQAGLEPGDVLVIGDDGRLARSTRPYQRSVAGVHATKPGLLGGAHDGADLADKVPLAVVGVVPVKVSSESGPIRPGDKLTASSTPGHAMRANDDAPIGTVIGKALGAFTGDQGVLNLLVILQ